MRPSATGLGGQAALSGEGIVEATVISEGCEVSASSAVAWSLDVTMPSGVKRRKFLYQRADTPYKGSHTSGMSDVGVQGLCHSCSRRPGSGSQSTEDRFYVV